MIAIDLGSNTLRVIELDCDSGVFGNSYEKIVKTADGLIESERVSQGAVERVVSAINEAKREIDFSKDSIRAVTTEALRRATNSDEVLKTIFEQTDVEFEIITGDEEARLTLLAVQYRLEKLQKSQEKQSFVLIDIGGGSTELIYVYGDTLVSKSFPVGIVTIAQRYETLERIDAALPSLMSGMYSFHNEVVEQHGQVKIFVATAGTPTTVAAMKLGQNYATYNPTQINGTRLEREELDFYLKKLLAMPYEEREVAVGVGRSDLIAAGILIFRQLYLVTGFDSCVVIDDGLREGVARNECMKSKNQIIV
jgi:exopolyphosphatase/guanosine-5'-triphosphate,3'-diphosphate pyrophosphatase